MSETILEHPVINRLLEQFVNRLETAFERTVEREGLISSGKLLNSIRAEGVKSGANFISSHVYYSDLLRVKDMNELTYTTIPPLAPLLDWVERTGVDKFAYVPGFKEGEESQSELQNIYRIASGIRYHLRASPSIRRGYRGIYNDPMKRELSDFYNEMRAAIQLAAMESFYNAFGYEIKIDIPDGEINTARIQSAMNAADTKLARKYANKAAGTTHEPIQGPMLPEKLVKPSSK